MEKFLKKNKAQTMIFEQVILFGIGVTIFITCFAIFNIYQEYFVSTSLNDQLGETRDWISSNILILTENPYANMTVILDVPKTIGGEEYEISLDDDGLTLQSIVTKTVKRSSLFNLTDQFKFSGSVSSSERRFVIYKKGNEIIIS